MFFFLLFFFFAFVCFNLFGGSLWQPGTKLSEDCCKYGVENPNDEVLAKAASIYGDARKHAEKEVEDLNKLFFSQVGTMCM